MGLLIVTRLAGGATPTGEPAFEPHRMEAKTFDRNGTRPAEVAGGSGDMTAVANYDFKFNYTFEYKYVTVASSTGPRVRMTLTRFTITGRQTTTIRIPSDAGQDLKDHELGHYRIYDFAYAKAQAKAPDMAVRLMAQTFEAADLEQAKAQLSEAFVHTFSDTYKAMVDRMTTEYDTLTAHGGNHSITANEAVRRVTAKRS